MWLKMYFKRLFKTPFFMAVIIALPVCAFFVGSAEKNSDEGLNIGLFFENSAYSKEITDKLIESTSLFSYKEYKEKNELEKNVLNGNLHCAYAFGDFLNTSDNKLNKNSITCIKTDSSILSSVSDESVFSAISSLYGYMPALDFKESNHFAEMSADEINEKYSYYVSSGLTYSFIYEMIGSGHTLESDISEDNAVVFPIREIGAIVIMLSAVFGAVRFHSDEKKGLHKRLSPASAFKAAFLNIFSVVSLASASVFLSIIFSDVFTAAFAEISAILIYALIAVVFGVLLAVVSKESRFIVSFTPILTIGTIIFCPVFIDTEKYLPFAGIINKFFIPYYYLSVFYGKSLFLSILALFVLCAAAFLLYLRKR